MPVYVDQFESEITFTEDQSALNEQQIEALIQRVIRELDSRTRDQLEVREATQLRADARGAIDADH